MIIFFTNNKLQSLLQFMEKKTETSIPTNVKYNPSICETGFLKVLPYDLEMRLDSRYEQDTNVEVKYRKGLNTDKIPFHPASSVPGGLYYCAEKDILQWTWLGEYIVDVTVPPGTPVAKFGNKYKASAVVLTNIRRISDYIEAKYPMDGLLYHPDIIKWLCDDYKNIRHIKTQTPELCNAVLKISPYAIMYIRRPTEENWIDVLTRCGWLLCHLKYDIPVSESDDLGEYNRDQLWNQDEEDILLYNSNQPVVKKKFVNTLWSNETLDKFFKLALRDCGFNIRWIPSHLITYEYCRIAVTKTPDAIYCIENPAAELCMIAVMIDYKALQHIKTITKPLCMEAIQQSPDAIKFIPHRFQDDSDIQKILKNHQQTVNK